MCSAHVQRTRRARGIRPVTAVALLAEARTAGVTLRLAGAIPKVVGHPTPELLARLRAARVKLIEILHGDRCRWCGKRMGWPGPVGIVEGAGTAMHHGCYGASEV